MSLIRAEEVVRYARWFRELMSGRVEVQSSARRSYSAVVMPTDALLTLGMLKLTSLMLKSCRTIAVSRGGCLRQLAFQLGGNAEYMILIPDTDVACWNALDVLEASGVYRKQICDDF